MTHDKNRRRFVLASASAAALSQLGAMPRAFAQSQRIAVPEVDSLTVRVITDSSYDTPRIAPSKHVKVVRKPFTSNTDFRKTLHNEWGLALALESRIGAETRHMMLDFGYTPRAYLNNLEILGIEPTKTQALVVSHGHFDHSGGLVGYLQEYRSKLPADLTLYVGGEDVFCVRKRGGPGSSLADAGYLDRRELEKLNIRVVTCEKPTVLLGHGFTTGIIPRNSFEKVLPQTLVEYFPSNGVGCNIPAANEKAGGKAVHDEHIHEHGTCFNVKGKGLVVMSSCGHSGIINTVRAAQQASGVQKVHAALGGFHLFPAPEDYVRKTVDEFKAMNPDVIIPMHCSGPSLLAMLKTDLVDRLVFSSTGTEITFGA